MVSKAFVKINYSEIGQYLTIKGVLHSLFSVNFVIGLSELQSIGYRSGLEFFNLFLTNESKGVKIKKINDF